MDKAKTTHSGFVVEDAGHTSFTFTTLKWLQMRDALPSLVYIQSSLLTFQFSYGSSCCFIYMWSLRTPTSLTVCFQPNPSLKLISQLNNFEIRSHPAWIIVVLSWIHCSKHKTSSNFCTHFMEGGGDREVEWGDLWEIYSDVLVEEEAANYASVVGFGSSGDEFGAGSETCGG